MITPIALLVLTLAAEESVVLRLSPNTADVLQCDNLLVLSIIENRNLSAVKMAGELRHGWIRYEIEKDGKWVRVAPTADQIAAPCGIGDAPLLKGESTYAECAALHRWSVRGKFLFESPGTYKIRAVATMPWGDIASEPVRIAVKSRDGAGLRKIDSVPPWDLWGLGMPSLEQPLPEELIELKSVGGNIGKTITTWEMVGTACEGGDWKGHKVSKDQACEWLKENLEPVAFEHSMILLGSYYRQKKYWSGLPAVVSSMKHDSMTRQDFLYYLAPQKPKREPK